MIHLTIECGRSAVAGQGERQREGCVKFYLAAGTFAPGTFMSRAALKAAVDAWNGSSRQAAAEFEHGPISTWDVSRVDDD